MRHLNNAVFLGVAALCGAQTAHAAQAEAEPKWQVDYGEQRCTLLRKINGTSPLTLALRIIPGQSRPELMIVNPQWRSNPLSSSDKLEIRMPPSGELITARGVSVRLAAAGRSVMVDGLPVDFIDRFARSSELVISSGTKKIAEMSYTASSKAVTALQECNDDLLRSWGVDPAAEKALKSPVLWRGEPRDIFRASDYPNGALMSGSSGTVVIVHDVRSDGRVTKCRVVGSSGNALLDKQTCESIIARGHFVAATAADGKPVDTNQVMTVNWVVLGGKLPMELERI